MPLFFTIKIVVFPMWRLIYHSLIFPEAFNLYDIDKNGFITMKKMTDIIDAISSMVENTKMKICQRREEEVSLRWKWLAFVKAYQLT